MSAGDDTSGSSTCDGSGDGCGLSDCTCNAANIAFRFSDDQVEVAHAYLATDAEAARRRAELE